MSSGKNPGSDSYWPLIVAAFLGLLFALGYGVVAVLLVGAAALGILGFFLLACLASGFAQSGTRARRRPEVGA